MRKGTPMDWMRETVLPKDIPSRFRVCTENNMDRVNRHLHSLQSVCLCPGNHSKRRDNAEDTTQMWLRRGKRAPRSRAHIMLSRGGWRASRRSPYTLFPLPSSPSFDSVIPRLTLACARPPSWRL